MLTVSPCGFQSCANIRVCFDRQAGGPGDRYRTAQDAAWPTEQWQPLALSFSQLATTMCGQLCGLSTAERAILLRDQSQQWRSNYAAQIMNLTAFQQQQQAEEEGEGEEECLPAPLACPPTLACLPALACLPTLACLPPRLARQPTLPCLLPLSCLPTLACLPALAMYNKLFASAPG